MRSFLPESLLWGCDVTTRFMNKSVYVIAFTASLICFLVYLQSLSCGFINWDDQDYVLNNTAIRSLDSIVSWAFTTNYLGWWMPLTWISFAIDYHFWGLNPQGYHLTNIVLHAVNSGLVVLIADVLLRQWSKIQFQEKIELHYVVALLLAGVLFGLHPLRVESVAWVTERKDVLNGFFTLGTMLFYLRYLRVRECSEKKGVAAGYYIMSLLFFMLSLLAKSVSVVIPVMLLLADWCPFGRMRKENFKSIILEKIPFMIMSVLMTALTIWLASQDNTLVSGVTFWQRAIISGNALFEYCRLMVFPINIIPVYVIPSDFAVSYALKAAVVVAFTVFAVIRLRVNRGIAATWLSFIIPLLPTLAFTQNGFQAFAARFTYLPSVVVSIVVANVITRSILGIAGRYKCYWKSLMSVLVLAVVICYVTTTGRLIDVWKDSGNYWSRVIAFQPFDMAYFYRGLFYSDTGKYEAAISDFTACLNIGIKEQRPDLFNLYAFRGEALVRAGRYDEAVRDLTTALEINPQPIYFYYRGLAYKSLGKLKQSEDDFGKAGSARGLMRGF